MQIYYRTKVNINGNSYKLKVDTTNKTFERGYYAFIGSKDDIVVPRKQINEIIQQCKNESYQEVNQ